MYLINLLNPPSCLIWRSMILLSDLLLIRSSTQNKLLPFSRFSFLQKQRQYSRYQASPMNFENGHMQKTRYKFSQKDLKCTHIFPQLYWKHVIFDTAKIHLRVWRRRTHSIVAGAISIIKPPLGAYFMYLLGCHEGNSPFPGQRFNAEIEQTPRNGDSVQFWP